MEKLVAFVEKGGEGNFGCFTEAGGRFVLAGRGRTARAAMDDLRLAGEELWGGA